MSDKVLGIIVIVVVAIIGIGCVMGYGYVSRVLHNVVTPITIHQVKPGVTCALANTSTGTAISCWKD